MNVALSRKQRMLQDPPFAQKLFSAPAAGWFWLILRVWLGYQWIEAGLHKVEDPAWTQTGLALKGFWEKAVAIPESGRPAIAFDWYRGFIQSLIDAEAWTWFAPLVAYGETLIGIALILGAFTGIAAFMGAFMNWNFMMAGTASTNPMLFVIAIGLILAWKVSGYVGLDYYLLNWLGTPWDEAQEEPAPFSEQLTGAPAK